MQKSFFIIAVMLFSATIANVYAAKANTLGGIAVPDPAKSSTVMSGEQFKGTVDSLGKQTNSSVSQTVQSQVKSSPTSPPAPPVTESTSTTSTTQPASTETEPAARPQPAAPAAAPPSTTAPAAQPAAQLPQQPAPASSDTYTGFGGGQQQQQKSGGQDQNSKKSWNVGY